jgi:cell division protein FtsI/penicillin-binding protein 2
MPRFEVGRKLFQWIDREGDAPFARQERAGRRAGQVMLMLGVKVVIAFSAGVMSVVHVQGVVKYAIDNQTSCQTVNTPGGDLLDRNGATLATDLACDHVTADPRWVLPPGYEPQRRAEEPEIGAAVIDEEVEAQKAAQPDAKPAKRDKTKVKTMAFDSAEARELRRLVGNRIAEVLGANPELRKEIEGKLAKPTGFNYLAKQIDAKAARTLRQMMARGLLPGVKLEREYKRIYPNNGLAGPAVGARTGGLDASNAKLLAGQPVKVCTYKDSVAQPLYIEGAPDPMKYSGHSLATTLDKKIQGVAEHRLEAAVKEHHAHAGIAVVMDILTGEVLAMAQAPSFDPNDAEHMPAGGFHNMIVEHQYEPGSTFKVFTIAAALQEGVLSLTEIIAIGAPIVIGSKLIKDDHPHAQCKWWQCFQVSSNIAMTKIVRRMSKETFGGYLVKLGFGKRLDLGLTGEGPGQLALPASRWPEVQFANIAFGQGIAVTPLQLAAAYAAVANGGIYRRPRLVREELGPDGKVLRPFEVEPGVRVFSEGVSKLVVQALASVTQPKNMQLYGDESLGGTGTQARMANYTIGGKTGTAAQTRRCVMEGEGAQRHQVCYDIHGNVGPGGYDPDHWVGSFIGVTPIEKPRLVVMVAIDGPEPVHYGGIVAAPVVRDIARFALPYLGVPPSPGAPYLDKNDPEKARRDDEARQLAAGQAASQLVAAGPPSQETPPDLSQPVGPGETRVPDLYRLPMRVVRERLHAAGLQLAAHGSGVAVAQGPLAGAVVAKGAEVHVNFRRLSEATTTVQAAAVVAP